MPSLIVRRPFVCWSLLVGLSGCPAPEDAQTETDQGTTGGDASTTDGTLGGVACLSPVGRNQPDSASSPSGFVECGDGLVHRERLVACEIDASAAGDCERNPGSDSPCLSDEECGEQSNGFCLNSPEPQGVCSCNYVCTSDADCGEGSVCYCDGARSTCVDADCVSDDDCPGELLCVLDEQRRACGDVNRSLRCMSPDDECRTDADCDDCMQCLAGPESGPRSCTGNTGLCGPCG